MSEKFRQDMPPEGGYRTFNWHRTYGKIFWQSKYVVGFTVLTSVFAFFYQLRDYPKRKRTLYFEETDAINAMEPFLVAERDRQVLRTMKKNYELEKELMKDVPGWKVGTWYGEPVYFTLGEKWIEPHCAEVSVHLKEKDWAYNYYWRLLGPYPWRW